MDNEQLYKRQNGNYKEVYPNTLLSSILDKKSGKSFKDIISAYNHLYVPFVNNIYETLTAIPIYIRRKGLWVTWETEDGLNTYQFNLSTAEAADDSIWGNIESWEQVPDLDYYEHHAAVPNGSITLDKLSDEVRQWLVNAGKIINYPDEEDITKELGLLKLADRPKISGVNSMGYKILRRNKTFAEQVTEENTIYEIKYDFTLDENVTIPNNCVLYFNGGSINTHVITVNNTNILGCPKFINTTFRGTIINNVIKSEWFNTLDNFATSCSNTRGYTKVFIKKGTYTLTTSFNLEGNIDVDFDNSTINVNDLDHFLNINITDNRTLLTTLSQAAEVNDRNISVNSVSDIHRGDILILQDETPNSYNSYNVVSPVRNYKQGEFIMVHSIEGNTINLVNPLYGRYITANLANCKLYKITLYKCSLQNLHLENNKAENTGEKFGILINNSINTKIRNIICNGYDIAIDVSMSYNILVEDCELTSSLYTTQGTRSLDQYGVCVSNSQNVITRNIIGSFSNHVVATVGGTFPVRNILMEKIVSRSLHLGYCGINMHGATEYTTINECNVEGIDIGGDYISIKNSIINSRPTVGSDNYAIAIGEITGYNITIDNCTIYGKLFDRLTHFGGLIQKDSFFKIFNSTITGFDETDLYRRSNYTGKYTCIIDGCHIYSSITNDAETWNINGINNNPYYIIKNSIIEHVFFNCRSAIGNISLINNDINLNTYLMQLSTTVQTNTIKIMNNRIVHTSNNTSYTIFIFANNGENSLKYLIIENNFFICTACSPLKISNENVVENTIFKGNILDISSTSYITLKTKHLYIDKVAELNSTNHIFITATTKTEGTDYVNN